MIVRQYKIYFILVIVLLNTNYLLAQDTLNIEDDAVFNDIEELNKQFEEYFNDNNIHKLADLYKKRANLLVPGDTYRGNKEIFRYWEKQMDNSLLNFEVIEVSPNEKNIYENQYYRALKEKPAGWRQRGIELDDDKPLIYQLGRANFKSSERSKDREIDYIIVWQIQPDGTYKIVLHTFS